MHAHGEWIGEEERWIIAGVTFTGEGESKGQRRMRSKIMALVCTSRQMSGDETDRGDLLQSRVRKIVTEYENRN